MKKYIRLFFAAFAVFTILLATTYLMSGFSRKVASGSRINILLVGISEWDYSDHAEVVRLISYEPLTGFADVLAIPRDTMVPVPYEVAWRRIQKLDEYYARLAKNEISVERLYYKFTAKIIELLQGAVSVDYYIQIDFTAFKDILDAMGGVDIMIEKEMFYEDKAQNLYINFSTGTHHLNGDDALKYVRYRDKITGDIGRQQRQAILISELIEKMKSPVSILRLPNLMKAAGKSLKTNLGIMDVLPLLDEFRNLDISNFRNQMLPGDPVIRGRKSYWKVRKEHAAEVLDVITNSHLASIPLAIADKKHKLTKRITAEVWNASNLSGMARDLTDYLRKRNVDVVRYGNYGIKKKYTQVISRNGDVVSAREVGRVIGCDNIKTEIDRDRMVDVNIVIGGDFRKPWKEKK